MSGPNLSPRPNAPTGVPNALRIYLRDHRAAASGGLALARRSLRSNRDSAMGAVLGEIVRELEEDLRTLTAVMDQLSVPESRSKRALTAAGERLGRLKLNGQLTGYSDLGRLFELELLRAGIDAKRSLWRSLQVAPIDLDGIDLDDLVKRAGRQRAMLQPFHRDAAHMAFSSSTDHAPV